MLTSINNRRYMSDKLREESEMFKQNNNPFSIAICDIDDFKKINDKYGHDCGDIVLKEIANILKLAYKEYDIEICRWGGEEFLILLRETIFEAEKICQIILNEVRKYLLNYNNKNISVTMTIGIAEFNNENNNIELVLKNADINLYKGKSSNKNCIII